MNEKNEGTRPEPTVVVRRDGSTTLSYGPAKGSRSPFREGNMMALKHGAYSDRIVEEVAVTVAQELRGTLRGALPPGQPGSGNRG